VPRLSLAEDQYDSLAKYSILFFNHPAHYKSAAVKAELDDQVEKGQPSALSLMPTNNLKILIADDKHIIMKGLYDFLKDIGFQAILQASNRKDDLKQILQVKPDLAILDLEIPKLTGIEVAARCKSEGSATKIILLTLHKKIYRYQQAKDLNFSRYILKDFALDVLSKAITTVLSDEQFFSEQLFKDMNINQSEAADYTLTPSEIKILRLVSQGLSTK